MATQVNWSEKAANNIEHIYSYIAEDSSVYAERFVRSLIFVVESQLKTYPLIGRMVPEFENSQLEFLREVIYKGYRIIYNPKNAPEKLTIITVLNSKMDVVRHVKPDWEIE